jgi:hypothetical protein
VLINSAASPSFSFRLPAEAGSDGDDVWDDRVGATPAGTFFQTRRWARLVTASFAGLKDHSFRLETEAGPVLFPIFAWSRAGGLLLTCQSSFPFLYGGPLPSTQDAGAWRELLGRVRGRAATWRLTGNPFAEPAIAGEEAGATRLRSAGFRVLAESTHRLRLPATEAGYWDNVLSPAKRNDVRRLGRKGVAVEETTAPADAEAVYRLYLASFRRWGGRPRFRHPPEFYRNLLALGSPSVRLTVARHGGRVIGGAFTVRWNGKAHYLAGYFDHESRALRPNVLIQVESIRRAIQDGFEWYDFLPSGGRATVEEFKESFGGRRAPYSSWLRTGIWHRLLGRGADASGR